MRLVATIYEAHRFGVFIFFEGRPGRLQRATGRPGEGRSDPLTPGGVA